MEQETEAQTMFDPIQFSLNNVSVVADSFVPLEADPEISEEV